MTTFAASQGRMEKPVVDRSKFYELDDVSIFDLQLDSYNPRIRHGADQHDCIERIADDREAFLRLMKDIASNGLSPQHILLSKSPDDGKLIVRDGNRRMTALKLLNRPDLALPDEALRSLVARIAAAATTPVVNKVNCLVCDDEATIVDYLRRLHTGENGGIGQKGWDALLIALFNAHAGVVDQNRRAAQLILWMEERGKHVSNEFPITTLTRVLNTETLAILGFSVKDDKLLAALPESNTYALASRVIDDIANNIINVTRGGGTGSVFALDDALKYVRSVRAELGPPEARTNGQSEHSAGSGSGDGNGAGSAGGSSGHGYQHGDGGSSGSAASGGTGSTSSGAAGVQDGDQQAGASGSSTSNDSGSHGGESNGSGAQAASSKGGSSNTAKAAWDRPCLFGRRKGAKPDFVVPNDRNKVITIVNELRQLDPNIHSMAVTMLFRALLELSDGAYRKAHNMGNDSLHKSIASSSDKMLNDGLLSIDQHHVIHTYTRSEQTILHVRSIQKFIHDDTYHPNGQGLNTMWDSIGCFVKACWDGVKRAGS